LLASLGEPRIEPWLAGWPTHQELRGAAAASAAAVQEPLSVLRWLPMAANAAPPLSAELCAMLADAPGDIEWRQTHMQADAAFLDRYGWCELIGPRAQIRSDRMACGFLLLGPDTYYPTHSHEPEELYVPLSGIAAWRQGAGDWQQRPPGTLIHHASFEPHAMRTDADPLLALYIWRGGNVHAKASFLPP
jgi:hypothetical protein